ncbi:MAG: tyrosine-type recombinase/integrase [Acidobacteriota bacterium]|nr:tyrosine-type recombinase/integrase [Acidobacteriota bacterium]
MTIESLTEQYVAFRKSAGTYFRAAESLLKTFCRAIGGQTQASEIRNEQIQAFIDGNGPLTRYWHRKHSVLLGFYRYAVSRGYVAEMPLPLSSRPPKQPASIVPYIYTIDEIRRLLDATISFPNQKSHIPGHTFRTLLLVLYGTGLRIGEALDLTLADVDLAAGVFTIRETKFYKTRLVPIGPDLQQVINEYVTARRPAIFPQGPDAAFFVDYRGAALIPSTVRRAFRRLRAFACVARTDGARYQPRLHDFRHAFTVHRLTTWYREGADVQKLLPRLSTYLGHVSIGSTQTYLTMTPDLLYEASQRFERYAIAEGTR